MLLFISAHTNLINANTIFRPFRNTDICGKYNNHRVYLELNEKGILKAENATHYKTVGLNPINLFFLKKLDISI